MRYAIFTKNSWWRGVTEDDHVVFYIREAENDDEILKQLDPDGSHEMTVRNLEDDDYLKENFNVDTVITQIG